MEPETSLESFTKLLAQFSLASNLTAATCRPIAEIAELVYIKFDLDVSDFDFEETIKEYGDEISEAVESLKAELGDNPVKEKLRVEFEKRTEIGLHARNLFKAKKALDEVKKDFEETDQDLEFVGKVVELVASMLKIRARKDIVPLIYRGVYANDIKAALDFWKANCYSEQGKQESTWQNELALRTGVLERVLGGRVVLLQEQAYVAGTGLNGKGDKIADYLFQHTETRDVTFVEIKTPSTKLLGKPYRGTYAMSEDLSGSIAQVLSQRLELTKNFYQKVNDSSHRFEVNAPRCFVIAGSLEKEVSADRLKQRAFELHRNAVASSVTVLTFDELYGQFARFNVAG